MKRLLGRKLTKAERAVMLEEARAMLGTPWKHQGRTERGVDCLGYVWMVLGRTLARTRGEVLGKPRSDYGLTPHNHKLESGLREWLGTPIKGEPHPGDIAAIRWTGDEHHVAIVTAHPFYGLGLIHADNTAAGGGRVVEHGYDEVWRRRYVEGFRP